MKEWLKIEYSDTQPANYFSTSLFSPLNISPCTAHFLQWYMRRKRGKRSKARLSVLWQLCGADSVVFPFAWGFCAHSSSQPSSSAMHSHIPVRVFVVDVISSSEDFTNLLRVCVCLGLRKFCARGNSPSSNSAAACCEIPRRCTAMHSPDPRTTEHSAPCRWGPAPLEATPHVKAIVKEGQYLMTSPASTELVSPNWLHATARSFNKPVVKKDLRVQHKVYFHYWSTQEDKGLQQEP